MCSLPTFTIKKQEDDTRDGMTICYDKKEKGVPPTEASEQLNGKMKEVLKSDNNARILVICETQRTAKLTAVRASLKGMKSAFITGRTCKNARLEITEKHRQGEWKILCITPKLALIKPPVASHIVAFQVKPETFTLTIK